MNRSNAGINAFALGELRFVQADRVLKIGFGGGLNLPADIFTARTTTEIVGALAKAGFRNVRFKCPMPATPWSFVVATRCA